VGRLIGLAVLAPAAVVAAGPVPAATVVAGIAVAAAAIGWALRGGWRGWAVGLGPGAILVVAAAPGSLASYVAGALAGPIVWESLRRGRTPGAAVVRGAWPAVALAIGAAATGFQPIPDDVGASVTAVFEEVARQGELPAERIVELRERSEAALAFARRTWVASEAVWIWVSVALGYGWARRLVGGPGFGRFARLDLPDGLVWVLIAGLAAMLLGRDRILGVVGTNLVFVTGFAFSLRGFAIESWWMDRAGLGRVARVALFAGGAVLFLPVFLVLAAGLGLFDTWFDFRRQRDPEPGGHPFSFLRRSSGDDANEKE